MDKDGVSEQERIFLSFAGELTEARRAALLRVMWSQKLSGIPAASEEEVVMLIASAENLQ